MTIARSVADVLRNHVVLEYEAIDRRYLNVYVPHLQTVGATAGVSAGAPRPAVCFDGGGGAGGRGIWLQPRGIRCGGGGWFKCLPRETSQRRGHKEVLAPVQQA